MRRLAFAVLVGVAMTILSACRATTASPELTGQPWQLTSITESSPAFTALIPPADQSRYQITFKTDNSYFATADCNSLVGTYVARDAKLTIKVGPSTLVACGSGSFGAIFAHALTSCLDVRDRRQRAHHRPRRRRVAAVRRGQCHAGGDRFGRRVSGAIGCPEPHPVSDADADSHAEPDTGSDTEPDTGIDGQADRRAELDAGTHASPHRDAHADTDPGPERRHRPRRDGLEPDPV